MRTECPSTGTFLKTKKETAQAVSFNYVVQMCPCLIREILIKSLKSAIIGRLTISRSGTVAHQARSPP
jgi:hypothetical protein